MKPINIIRYATLLKCLEANLGRKIESDEIRYSYFLGHNGTRPYRVNFKKWIDSNPSHWGWAEYRTKTIHIYVSPECTQEELIYMLAHEAAHLRRPRYKDKKDEERKAVKTGLDARFAYEASRNILKEVGK